MALSAGAFFRDSLSTTTNPASISFPIQCSGKRHSSLSEVNTTASCHSPNTPTPGWTLQTLCSLSREVADPVAEIDGPHISHLC